LRGAAFKIVVGGNNWRSHNCNRIVVHYKKNFDTNNLNCCRKFIWNFYEKHMVVSKGVTIKAITTTTVDKSLISTKFEFL
jgi:hypothetical protein